MNDSHTAAKVGFFVFVTACLGALLILSFTKGVTAFGTTTLSATCLVNTAPTLTT